MLELAAELVKAGQQSLPARAPLTLCGAQLECYLSHLVDLPVCRKFKFPLFLLWSGLLVPLSFGNALFLFPLDALFTQILQRVAARATRNERYRT